MNAGLGSKTPCQKSKGKWADSVASFGALGGPDAVLPMTIQAASVRIASRRGIWLWPLSWTFVLSFPLMVAIQEVSAEIGRVTGAGIARNLRRHYQRPLLWSIVALLLVANIVNLEADLSAMGAAFALLVSVI